MAKRKSEHSSPRVKLVRSEISASSALAARARKTKGIQAMPEPRRSQTVEAKCSKEADFDAEAFARELEPKMDAALLLLTALDAAARVTEEDLKTRVSI
jgi:hypothetical protein